MIADKIVIEIDDARTLDFFILGSVVKELKEIDFQSDETLKSIWLEINIINGRINLILNTENTNSWSGISIKRVSYLTGNDIDEVIEQTINEYNNWFSLPIKDRIYSSIQKIAKIVKNGQVIDPMQKIMKSFVHKLNEEAYKKGDYNTELKEQITKEIYEN